MRAKHGPSVFDRFAKGAAHRSGSPAVFIGACFVIGAWLCIGPLLGFSDTWQLWVNTATTIVTFLMVFLIQNSQNRDATATQIKLDEMIRALRGAHNALLDLEALGQDELEGIRSNYEQLARDARRSLREGGHDTGCVEMHPASRRNGHRRKAGQSARRNSNGH